MANPPRVTRSSVAKAANGSASTAEKAAASKVFSSEAKITKTTTSKTKDTKSTTTKTKSRSTKAATAKVTKPKAKAAESKTKSKTKSTKAKEPAQKDPKAGKAPTTSEAATAKPSPHVSGTSSRKRGPEYELSESITRAKKVKFQPDINEIPTEKLDVFVFGSGECGELGLGVAERESEEPTEAARPTRNELLDHFAGGPVQIAAGGMHCAAITCDSQIVTWGVNDKGALGRDTIPVANDPDNDNEWDLNPRECIPTAVPTSSFGEDVRPFTQVVATDSATFALTANGSVYGWGQYRAADGGVGFTSKEAKVANDKGEDAPWQATPILMPNLAKIKSLATGTNHVLALDHKGKVYAWGCGEQYQLGRRLTAKTRISALEPHLCPTPQNIESIACGANHSFAINEDGQVYAWGLNNFGQTGINNDVGEDGAVVTKPTLVKSLQGYDIWELQGGEHHSIACTVQGDVLVWGRCDDCQMGMPLDNIPSEDLVLGMQDKPRVLLKPTKIEGLAASTVAAGIDMCLVVSPTGQAYAWGYSGNNRTGLGDDESVRAPTLLNSKALRGRAVSFAACGGQFSVLASPAQPAPIMNGSAS